jgi:hypothetical protein
MSGGGGTGDWSVAGAAGSQVGGGGVPGELPCDRLEFDARLRSVDDSQLDDVEVGDTLLVGLHEGARPVVAVFRIVPGGGPAAPLGVLADRLSELAPCLQLRDFAAEVLSINGGDVRVHVYPGVG